MIMSSLFMDFILVTFYLLCCEYSAVPYGPAYIIHGGVWLCNAFNCGLKIDWKTTTTMQPKAEQNAGNTQAAPEENNSKQTSLSIRN